MPHPRKTTDLSPPAAPPPPPTQGQILAGGEFVEIRLAGVAAHAWVRQIRPTELVAYLRAEGEGEEAVLALVAERAAEEGGGPLDLDALDLAGYEALIAADGRQNFTAARAREQRELARAARQMAALRESDPETYQVLHARQATAMESLLSSLGASSPGPGAGGPSAR